MRYVWDVILAAAYFFINYLTFRLIGYVFYNTAMYRLTRGIIDKNPHLPFLVWYVLSFTILFIFFKLMGKDLITYSRFNTLGHMNNVIILILIGIGGYLFNTALTNISYIYKTFPQFQDFLSFNYGKSTLLVGIIASVLVGPIYEEVLFRGVIFNQLRQNMPILIALLIQSLLYGLLFFNIPMGIFCFIAGSLYAFIYLKTNTLWAVIIIQIVETSLVLLSRRTAGEGWFHRQGDIFNATILILSIIIVVFSCLMISKSYKATQQNTKISFKLT